MSTVVDMDSVLQEDTSLDDDYESTLRTDLQSLLRVRNRLAQSPDAAMSKILNGLLPRLLGRMERNHALLLSSSTPTSSSRPTTSSASTAAAEYVRKITTKEQRLLVEKAQTQVTGTLGHALERIRVGRYTIPDGAPWIHSLLPLLQQPKDDDWQSPVATTFLLLILQCSFPWYVESSYDNRVSSSHSNDTEPPEDILFLALPALSHFVHIRHCKILAAIATEGTAQELNTVGSAHPGISETLLLHYHKASWLCLDVLALSWGLPALIDWDRDHFDEYDYSTPCCSTAKEAFLEHGIGRHDRSNDSSLSSMRTFLNESGSFQLWLDCLLFWPAEKTPQRQHRRVVRTDAEILVENSTGMTLDGLRRMNHRCKDAQSWNPRYLRELKLACMHSVVVDPLRYLPDPVTSLDDISDNLSLLRSLILCILISSTGSMHGKVALEYVNKVGLRFAGEYSGPRVPSGSDPWPFGDTSLVLASSLLTLVLGDEVSNTVLEKHAAKRAEIDAILGQFQGRTDENNPHSKMLSRAPMPFGVGEGSIDFIVTRLLPVSTQREGSPLALKPGSGQHVDKTNGATAFLPVFIDLVEALSVSKGTIGSYWAIQCMDSLHSHFSVPVLKNENSKGINGIVGADDWRQDFNLICLRIASRVLSQIAEVDAEILVTLGEVLQQTGDQVQPGGVHRPFGGRRDLNVMLAQHRTSQKKRQLRVDCALLARQQAYRIVTELASCNFPTKDLHGSRGEKSSAVLDMPIVLLKCASGEEETSMDPLVAKALEAWLDVYNTFLQSAESSRLKTLVAALLPSLLCAVCSESSVARLAAVKWVAGFIVYLDPAVTWHVCRFLADDDDLDVSALAKKALKSMEANTVMEDVEASVAIRIDFFDLSDAKDKAAIKLDLESQVHQTAASLDISSDASRILLGDFKFDIEAAVESCSNDRSTTLELSGLNRRCEQDATMSEGVNAIHEAMICCGICYDEIAMDGQHKMPCGHKFCHACWHTYVCCALDDRQLAAATVLSLTCPEQHCNERVSREDLDALAPDRLERWDNIELQAFLRFSKTYSSCTGPDCQAIAHITRPKGQTLSFNPTTQCHSCNTSFCFACGSNAHLPAKCDDFAEWNRIFGSSHFWVKKNAKPCPNCDVPIEKNEGCNHIRCSLCRHDFCWLCLGHLRTHNEPHICNRYEAHESAEDDEERRALFFTDRFKAHDDAEAFASKEAKSFEEKLEKLTTETLWFASEEDLDNLLNAAKTLVQARNFLKNSYVAAWAMRKDLEHRDAFDSHQANLELFTEKLSQLLLTKMHQLYAEQGPRAVRVHFRAMLFSTASLEQYMKRIVSFIGSN